jgi:hypothetical protein
MNEKLSGFFVKAESGGLATRPTYSIYYGPFATYEKAAAFNRHGGGDGEIHQYDLHQVSSRKMTHEEYEREFARLPHLITPTERK